MAFLRDYAKESFWGDEEVWVNALKIPGESLSTVLKDYLGLTMEDVTIPEDWTYFEETDAYYSIHSDGYGVSGHTVTEVTELEDGTIQVFWTVGLLKNAQTGAMMAPPDGASLARDGRRQLSGAVQCTGLNRQEKNNKSPGGSHRNCPVKLFIQFGSFSCATCPCGTLQWRSAYPGPRTA